MADTTDIPPTPVSANEAIDGGASVPERPEWLDRRESASTAKSTEKPVAATPRQRRSASRKPAGSKIELDSEQEDDRSVLDWLLSAAAKGYGLSLFVHLLLVLAMALYIFPEMTEVNVVTTVVQSDTETLEEFDALDDVKLSMPAGAEEVIKPQLTEIIEADSDLTLLESDFLRDVTAAESQGDGGSTSGKGGGFRLLEPKNAVRKGSFTAWTIPIARRFGEKPKAGDSPRPGQPYYIVIQVKLQKGRRTYKISDLSGKIIGTDGYQQLIPAMAFIQEDNGRLTRANTSRLLPIREGVSQILIKVPGAEALVKDTIQIKSRSLHENQTLEIEFAKFGPQ